MTDRSTTPPDGAHPGRPRNETIGTAVIDATLAKLDEVGYHHLTLGEVARLAGTTKPALYRRWRDKRCLVLDALSRRLGEAPTVPDTDCTLCDLSEGIEIYVRAFQRMPPDVLGPLLADCAGDEELRASFMSSLFDPPRAAVETVLVRAVARGDLREDLDHDLALDLLGSLIHYRALFEHAPISAAQIGQAVETLLRGFAVDYAELRAHSEAQHV